VRLRSRFTVAWTLALLTCVPAVEAQQTGTVWRVGVLWPGVSTPPPPRMEALREGLREAGYVEGQNLAIELRYSDEGGDRLRELAGELVSRGVHAIAAFGDLAPRTAQQKTTAIPIIAIADDVLGAGLVNSLARPGGNTTGVTIFSPELSAKRLGLLKELLPNLSRVAAIWDPASPSQLRATEDAARSLGVTLQVLEIRGHDDLARAFQTAKRARAQALNLLASPLLSSLSPAIIELAAQNRLPAIHQWKEHAEAGGLLSYGPSLAGLWRQAGLVVGKILSGAKPANLPVERPRQFELVINLKTARELGLTIPPALLVRADQIIE
jgi:putative tryptophan/tyrosine transport system substrate-binding protein